MTSTKSKSHFKIAITILLSLTPLGAYALGDIWPDPAEILTGIFRLSLPLVVIWCTIKLFKLIAKPENKLIIKSEDTPNDMGVFLLKYRVLSVIVLSAPLHAAIMYLASFFLTGIEIGQVSKFYTIVSIPTLTMTTLMWLKRRPKTSLGIGISWLLVSGVLMNLTLGRGKAVADELVRVRQIEPQIADAAVSDTMMLEMITDTSDQKIYTYVEQMPGFVGGKDALIQAIDERVQYPAQALPDRVHGPVYVSFIVQPDGHLTNVHVQPGYGQGYGCDEEAIRVVRSLPRFAPGQQNNGRVAVAYNIPIQFRPPKQ